MKTITSLWTGLAVLVGSLLGYAAFAETIIPTSVSQVSVPMSVQIDPNGAVRIVGTYSGQGETSTSTNINTSSPPNSLPATITVFTATLDSDQEVPSNTSTATGSATVQVNADQVTANVSLSFSGLSSNQTGAHIHGPASSGENSDILFPLSNGQITEQQITLTAQQFSDLTNGKWYVNVHTENNPSGEIRGQLVPTSSSSTTTTSTVSSTTSTAYTTSTTIFVSSWGTTWNVEINEATQFMRYDGTTTSLPEMSIEDQVTVIGTIATSTVSSTPSATTSTITFGPIIATSVQNNAIQIQTVSGTVVDESNLNADATSVDAQSTTSSNATSSDVNIPTGNT